jgi:myo-inositol-1-phosphate synthase
MAKVRVAIIGVGNCASSLIQGLHYYSSKKPADAIGVMHWNIGPYAVTDVQIAAAFDIDSRKVGKDVAEAIYQLPNCTTVFEPNVPPTGVKVQMGNILDGYSEHMANYDAKRTFLPADHKQPTKDEVVKILKDSKAEVMVNYLPVGSQKATEFYAECALEAGLGLVNCIPVFIGSNPVWAARFEERGLPIVGDDIKSQVGATIVHRVLTDLFAKRGVALNRTYQLNTGGNTDFLNMLNRTRLLSKKISKTQAVQSVTAETLDDENIHIGPSDYVPWQNDNKLCFLRMEGRLFGDVPMNIELRLSVEDSPNSAGVAIDMIRCCKIGLDRGIGGSLEGPSSYFCKHPAIQHPDDICHDLTESFIAADVRSPAPVKALILAAGLGSRLRELGNSKPLTELEGTPLIERIVKAAVDGGVTEFVVVVGYMGDAVSAFLETLATKLGVSIKCVVNDAWNRGNGRSVLAAKHLLGGPFHVMMADHIFEPAILRQLREQPLADGHVRLAVDTNLKNPLVDLDDVTKTQLRGHHIVDIGKALVSYTAFDTGFFYCTPSLFKAIERSIRDHGDDSLSGGIRELARQGAAEALDIGALEWIDIDDPKAFGHSKKMVRTATA